MNREKIGIYLNIIDSINELILFYESQGGYKTFEQEKMEGILNQFKEMLAEEIKVDI